MFLPKDADLFFLLQDLDYIPNLFFSGKQFPPTFNAECLKANCFLELECSLPFSAGSWLLGSEKDFALLFLLVSCTIRLSTLLCIFVCYCNKNNCL